MAGLRLRLRSSGTCARLAPPGYLRFADGGQCAGAEPMNGARRIGALVAVLVVALAVGYLLLGGGSDYTVKLRVDNASQLVKGNLVQVAGTTVGKVKKIGLTPDSQALITISVDGDYAQLKEGTQAVVRQASLSGVAHRSIDLRQGPMTGKSIPDGATLPASSTESAVDLDQLFGIFNPKVRADGRAVIKGF